MTVRLLFSCELLRIETMQRTKSQFSRILALDRQIRAGNYPNCILFADEWEVSRKTVQRDVDFLRDQLGAPLEYSRERKGFFYSDENWFLPALNLQEGDLVNLLIAVKAAGQYRGTPVAEHLQSICGKIAELLPEQISVDPELLYAGFSFTAPPTRAISPPVWKALVRGLLSRRMLRLHYAGKQKPFDVCPYHLANLQGEWYLFVGFDDSADIRQLSVGRIDQAVLLPKPFAVPETFDAGKLLNETFQRFAGDNQAHAVKVVFDKEVAPWVLERQWHPEQKVKTRLDGSVELSFRAKGLFEVMRWLLAWGCHVTVKSPKELRNMLNDEIRAMAQKLQTAESE
jgi:predicted DNA-binding transcriptional regulator YafY